MSASASTCIPYPAIASSTTTLVYTSSRASEDIPVFGGPALGQPDKNPRPESSAESLTQPEMDDLADAETDELEESASEVEEPRGQKDFLMVNEEIDELATPDIPEPGCVSPPHCLALR